MLYVSLVIHSLCMQSLVFVCLIVADCLLYVCCQPSVTELLRSPPLLSVTVFHNMSRQYHHWLSSAVTSGLISSSAASHDFTALLLCQEVTCHYGHVNRFCYIYSFIVYCSHLLTYLPSIIAIFLFFSTLCSTTQP